MVFIFYFACHCRGVPECISFAGPKEMHSGTPHTGRPCPGAPGHHP